MSAPSDSSGPNPPGSDLRAELLAALAWQVELGADVCVGDGPTDWFAAPEATPFALGGGALKGAGATAGARSAPASGPSAKAKREAKRDAKPDPKPDPLADAAALAAGAADLEALRGALAGFEGSPLKKGARSCVFADGVPGAWVMVVGEAPGRDEDRQGLPFVGRSGQLLDRMLAAIGLDRRSEDPATGAYIANVLPYRPLENRRPTDQEAQTFLPFLMRQIALARPRLLLCLGATPVKHVMAAETSVTRFRGTWRDVAPPGAPSIPALASFHPAYLLRSPDKKREAWRDLLSMRARLDSLGADANEGEARDDDARSDPPAGAG